MQGNVYAQNENVKPGNKKVSEEAVAIESFIRTLLTWNASTSQHCATATS